MRKLSLFILLLYCVPLCSQVITPDDFVILASLPDKKINPYVIKMGFVQVARSLDDGTLVNEFIYRNKKQPFDTVVRFLSGYRNGRTTGVSFQTSSFSEYQAVLRGFRLNGFMGGYVNAGNAAKADSTMTTDSIARTDSMTMADSIQTDTTTFFQKEDMTIRTNEEMRDEIKMFRILFEKKPPPTAIRFADDLLFFSSHENLVLRFGANNVRKDLYYFSETDSSRCSVVFPNSNRQAIFIWDDQVNYRTIAYLMIGGGLRAEGSSGFNQSVSLNTLRCYNGLYTGMRLAEIVRVNQADFNFYGTASDFALMAVPEKKGNIDFKKTGIVLGCFNCSGTAIMKAEKVSAEAAIAAGLQLYVVSIVLLP
jgi:hypothetical protein